MACARKLSLRGREYYWFGHDVGIIGSIQLVLGPFFDKGMVSGNGVCMSIGHGHLRRLAC
jgi:hypothetical protein